MGYAGGTKPDPDYHSLGDHTESIQIDYDPKQISYKELLHIFWSSHNPRSRSRSKQYRAAVFYHNEEQKRLALKTKDEMAVKGKIYTEILPLSKFYRAEDYHQKYYLRGNPGIAGELLAVYPEAKEFTDSTAAARLNGYIAGFGSAENLKKEIKGFGLSKEAEEKLLEKFRSRGHWLW